MNHAYLKGRSYYEDIYDRITVEFGRRNIVHYEEFYRELESKLKPDDQIDRPGNALVLNIFYLATVGDRLIDRYNRRDESIQDMMARDAAKDEQIAVARLREEPYCSHCHKLGLRIVNKTLMHRSATYNSDEPEEVLFMLRCPHCDKNSAFWEDGVAWKPEPPLCPKCSTEVSCKTAKSKKSITFTYTCPSCEHTYKDKMDLTTKEEEPDPDYDKDRITYCLLDKEFRDRLFSMKHTLEELARLGKDMKEKEDNKDVYDAVAKLKRLKIAELTPLLAPDLEKAGYIEFMLDKPEIGRDVFVGFSCLDNKSDRSDYDSRNTLKKLIEKVLSDTNWRLMSEGISYRLGYLSGRFRAYEREEDLKQLAELRLKKASTSRNRDGVAIDP